MTYRDTSSESHVPLSRIQYDLTSTVQIDTSNKSHDMNTAQKPIMGRIVRVEPNESEHAQRVGLEMAYLNNDNDDNDNFVVPITEDLEGWIEQEDPETLNIPSNDKYYSHAAKHQKEKTEKVISEEILLSNEPVYPDRSGKDFRVSFQEPPLGLTLTKGYSGRAEVTRVVAGGAAAVQDVQVGDVVVGFNGRWMQGYDEVMAEMASKGYPMTLVIRRGLIEEIGKRTNTIIRDSKVSYHTY